MAYHLDMVTTTRILSLVSGLILMDKMAVALIELRDTISYVQNNNIYFQNFVYLNHIRVDTVAWLDYISDNLEVADTWHVFNHISLFVQCDVHTCLCLCEISDF